MLAVAVVPVVEMERAEGRSGTLSEEGIVELGLEGKGGEDGGGLSKGVSLSSLSGVDAAESAMAEEGVTVCGILAACYCGVERGL